MRGGVNQAPSRKKKMNTADWNCFYIEQSVTCMTFHITYTVLTVHAICEVDIRLTTNNRNALRRHNTRSTYEKVYQKAKNN